MATFKSFCTSFRQCDGRFCSFPVTVLSSIFCELTVTGDVTLSSSVCCKYSGNVFLHGENKFFFSTLSKTSPCFYVSSEQEKTGGKGETAHSKQFLHFPQCFPSFRRSFCHFHLIQNCCLQTLSVWKSIKFVLRERVKGLFLFISFLFNFLLYSECI